MSKEIVHSVVLIFSIALAFVLARTGLSKYDLQLTAVLFIVFFVTKKFLIKTDAKSRLIESVIFTLIIVSIVNSTGGVTSPFFFLIYFLLFSLSLLLEPIISITATLTLIIMFLLSLPENQDLSRLLPIFSLAFITPFAMLLGQEYFELKNSKLTIQKSQTDALLFISLVLKNHVKSIKQAVENFMGDHELHQIKKHTHEIEKMIDKFEKQSQP